MENKFFERLNKSKQLVESFYEADSAVNIWHANSFVWLTIDGEQIQSLMDERAPCTPVLPVPQTMLLWILWYNNTSPINVLNIGMGTGTIERALSQFNNIDITAIETSATVIKAAQKHFYLPDSINIINDCGISFVNKRAKQLAGKQGLAKKYDIILADIFKHEKTPQDICHSHFYQASKSLLRPNGLVMVNLYLTDDQQLLSLLNEVGSTFSYKLLIDFQYYRNIVLVLSNSPLPEKEAIQRLLKENSHWAKEMTHAEDITDHLHYI